MSDNTTKEFMRRIGEAANQYYSYPEALRDKMLDDELKKLFPEPGKANFTQQDVVDIVVLRILKSIASDMTEMPVVAARAH